MSANPLPVFHLAEMSWDDGRRGNCLFIFDPRDNSLSWTGSGVNDDELESVRAVFLNDAYPGAEIRTAYGVLTFHE